MRPPPLGDTRFLCDEVITALRQDGDGVEGIFEHATPRQLGLVVDADGLAR
ncbi:hypothetical protein [Phytohabitans aurantiacus]|nr:hypothetical protein [Phytohabitans aurantiacus]